MKLTYEEALSDWTRYGGLKPIRTGPGPYDYRYGVASREGRS